MKSIINSTSLEPQRTERGELLDCQRGAGDGGVLDHRGCRSTVSWPKGTPASLSSVPSCEARDRAVGKVSRGLWLSEPEDLSGPGAGSGWV